MYVVASQTTKTLVCNQAADPAKNLASPMAVCNAVLYELSFNYSQGLFHV